MAEQETFYYSMSPEGIKSEPCSEDELEVYCRLCNKVFASNVALQNHARIVHIDAYETGDPNEWTDITKDQSKKSSKQDSSKLKTAEILSRMKPTSVTSLATQDVSYIIIKGEEPLEKKRKRERKKVEKVKEPKVKVQRPELRKEAEVITGPFECVEPSSLGADGTCHQMFFSCCEYSEHQLAEHTRPRRRAARCQVCERPLSQLHQTGPKDFTCEQCLEGFDTVNELIDHKNMFHFQKKKYECSVCQKKFSAQGGVVQHMRMHTGDRPYSCTYCPKAFTQKSGLEQHIRIHTKVKPFRCVICSKTFIQTVHLKQHMRTHTNVAPFQCVICEKRFKQSSHLNYHLKNHPANMTDEQKQKYRQIVSNHQQRDLQTQTQIKIEPEIEKQSYENEGQTYENEEPTYENEEQTYENEEQTYENEEQTYENEEQTYENEEPTYENEEQSYEVDEENYDMQDVEDLNGANVEVVEGQVIEGEIEQELEDGYEVIYE